MIQVKGTINIISHKLFAFLSGTSAANNIIQIEGQINLGAGVSDVIFFAEDQGRLVTRNLVLKSESTTRSIGLIPADDIEFHAESTTFVLSEEEIDLGSEAIYANDTSSAQLKSFFTNARVGELVENTITNGIVEANNSNIKE